MVKQLNIAVVQSNIAWEDIEANIKNYTEILDKIQKDVDVVVLPEMFTTGFSMNAELLAEPVGGKTTKWMQAMSKSKGFAICGSIITKDKGNFYNRFLFVKPNGDIVEYDKRHLFTFANEHLTYSKGDRRVVFEYLGWRILPQICYDLRFPVWSRNRNDYDLLINVANFPAIRRDIWTTLLKARAIENQCYAIGANRVGKDRLGIYYSGDSAIFGPNGEVVSKALPGEETVFYASIDLQSLDDFRQKFPIILDADNFYLSDNQ
jgi:predicted amidohydrolase